MANDSFVKVFPHQTFVLYGRAETDTRFVQIFAQLHSYVFKYQDSIWIYSE